MTALLIITIICASLGIGWNTLVAMAVKGAGGSSLINIIILALSVVTLSIALGYA